MRLFTQMFFLGALVGATTVATAESSLEAQAKHQAGTARFLIPTSKQCDAFLTGTPLMRPTVSKDTLGRVVTARNQYGHEFTIEYSGTSTKPIAIIAYGQRVQIGEPRSTDERLLEVLRARAILYEQVKSSCGVSDVDAAHFRWEDEDINCFRGQVGGSMNQGCGGGAPSAWFEPPFWTSNWMPRYYDATFAVNPVPQCVTTCQTFCGDTSRSLDIACGTIASAVAAVATPLAGLLVGAACLSGSHIGNIICRDYVCITRCR